MLSLGSKEIALTLPVVIFLYEWFFFQNLQLAWLKKRIPLIIGILVLLILIGYLFKATNPIDAILASYNLRHFTLGQRVLTEFRVVVFYISLLLYPHPGRLNLEHDFALSQSLFNPVTTLFSLALIVGCLAVAVVRARQDRLIAFCLLCFFGNLVLESSIVGLEIIFEHRTYLPSMFAIFALVLAGYRFIPNSRLRILVFLACCLIGALWTFERNMVWRSEIGFLQDCLEKSPRKWRVHSSLGNAMAKKGRYDEAIYHFETALQLNAYEDRMKRKTGQIIPGAGVDLEQAARKLYADLLTNLGNALVRDGCSEAGAVQIKKALELDPRHVKAHTNMGLVLSKQDKGAAAIESYRQALELDPDFAPAHNNLGLELAARGEIDPAINHYNKAIELDANFAEAYNNLGVQLARIGRMTEAVSNLAQAIAIRPDYAEAYYNLGLAQVAQGRIDTRQKHLSRLYL